MNEEKPAAEQTATTTEPGAVEVKKETRPKKTPPAKVTHKIDGKLVDFMGTSQLQEACKKREINIVGLNREQLLAALKEKLNSQVAETSAAKTTDEGKTKTKNKMATKAKTTKKAAKKAAPKAKAEKKTAAGRQPSVLKLKGFEVGEPVKFEVRGTEKAVQGKIRKFTKDPKGSDYVVIENNGRLMGKRIDKVTKVK